jgi:hypothetical protein
VQVSSGYGKEGVLLTLEARKQPYLLRLRQTKNAQRLVAQQFTLDPAVTASCSPAEQALARVAWMLAHSPDG